MHMGDKCISLPGERAILGTKGLFVRDLQLAAGTPVVLQICKGQDEVSLSGVVCASYADLGLAIQFKEKTDRALRRLATLLAA
jgi:hypothetical protein